MYAYLATATDDKSLSECIERTVSGIGLALRPVINEDTSRANLPKARQLVRSASVVIAALSRHNYGVSRIFNAISVAQSVPIPVVVVGEDEATANLRGRIFDEIPKENIFVGSSSDFPSNLARRLNDIISGPPPHPTPAGGAQTDYDVFLSYAGKDRPHVEKLSSFLREHEIKFWEFGRSPREYDVDFAEEIEKVIRNSKVFLAILTKNWRQSRWTQDEFKFARVIGKRQFVLEFEETEPTLILAGQTRINCRDNLPDGFHRMLKRLDELFERAM
jgi:hypothetical protein